MKKIIVLIILLYSSCVFAMDMSNVALDIIIPEDKQSEMGLDKLTPQEREKLRLYLIELIKVTARAGIDEGKKKAESTKQKRFLPTVIESQIDGDFEGWEGETIVKLMNGQIWQQTEYYYHYHYSFMPHVTIYLSGGTYKMKVDGINKAVGVRNLK